MTNDINWELYRSFLSVLQEGSLSAAARALGSTQPTIGRHIETLENTLKLTLFIRSQGGLLPTDAALALKPHAEAMASTAAALARAAASQNEGVSGVVRITASEVIGVEVLPPIIAALRNRHPALQIELMLSNRIQDLLHREADIAVRMVRPQQTQLIARQIGKIALGLYASQDYIDRYGMPTTFDELKHHALIGFDQPTAFIRTAAKSIPQLTRERFALRSDNDLAQLALIRAGAGIGVCQERLAEADPRLVAVLPGQIPLILETWITMHENLRQNPSCRAVFDALVSGLQHYIDPATAADN
ncbi:LysR family transcriptional regulator [Gynuella sunshinyii]|uniref:Transcriptional regulator n=1 Tax=Gynuella sunshinyii YC6258 TaxID=1445510 RepID=A0A0C5VFD3_9GAMM|nr:LysR family transcriptional regulator [Gynuella sunshinyii]AJQ97980.1 transcriptional regulator [Gynuella sunshinyii YC6258]